MRYRLSVVLLAFTCFAGMALASSTEYEFRMTNLRSAPPTPPPYYDGYYDYYGYYGYPQGWNGESSYPYSEYYLPYGGYGQSTVPPIIVAPPILANPVPPPPMRIRRLPDGSYIREPDPHFHRMSTAPYPDYLTTGQTIYPTPQYYYPPYPYPYLYGPVPPPYPHGQ